jgi:GNAT superfamily N-acetyltransferase
VRELLRPRPESSVFGAFAPELSGMLGFRRDTTLKAAPWGMFVLPARRGRGLALQLMRTAIEHARMLEGVASLHLCVSDAAPDAQRLYERVGFMTWGVELDAIRVTARSLNDHHMSLTL